MRMWKALLGLCVSLTIANAALAQGNYSDVTLTFRYDGSAPGVEKITPTKDVEYCGKFDIVDDSLLVNSANNGLANVILAIYVSPGKTAPTAAPSYAEALKKPVVVDNKGCMFVPHVSVTTTSQKVILKNSDTIGHNSKVDSFKNPAINPIIPAGQEQEAMFSAVESLPVKVSCNIHPWMGSWLVVKDHPYVGVSDADGKVTLKDVPVGKWTLQAWHEKAGYVQDVTVGGKKTKWSRGRFDVTVAAGKATEVGEVVVPASAFKN